MYDTLYNWGDDGYVADGNKNGMLDGVNSGAQFPERFTYPDFPIALLANRMNVSEIYSGDTARNAYNKVMTYAGASLYGNTNGTTTLRRNEVDAQLFDSVVNQTGKLILDNAECGRSICIADLLTIG